MAPPLVFTIGHSTHPIERFVALLKRNGIEALADVRSTPFSRFNPQFNKQRLAASLKDEGIDYLFLGKELGARSDDPGCYQGDQVRYERLAATPAFKEGLARVKKEAGVRAVALMCAEKDPLDCHRTILVGRELARDGFALRHILADGKVEEHETALDRLMKQHDLVSDDLFASRQGLVEEAYRRQGDAIAYRRKA
jgi:uncharacterized protein (DUF488 family)